MLCMSLHLFYCSFVTKKMWSKQEKTSVCTQHSAHLILTLVSGFVCNMQSIIMVVLSSPAPLLW